MKLIFILIFLNLLIDQNLTTESDTEDNINSNPTNDEKEGDSDDNDGGNSVNNKDEDLSTLVNKETTTENGSDLEDNKGQNKEDDEEKDKDPEEKPVIEDSKKLDPDNFNEEVKDSILQRSQEASDDSSEDVMLQNAPAIDNKGKDKTLKNVKKVVKKEGKSTNGKDANLKSPSKPLKNQKTVEKKGNINKGKNLNPKSPVKSAKKKDEKVGESDSTKVKDSKLKSPTKSVKSSKSIELIKKVVKEDNNGSTEATLQHDVLLKNAVVLEDEDLDKEEGAQPKKGIQNFSFLSKEALEENDMDEEKKPKNGLLSGVKTKISKRIKAFKSKKKSKADRELGDVNLEAFKGGNKDQSEEEQEKTDGFFSSLRKHLTKSCFDKIGCFSATEYFDSSNRPLPMLPMAPEKIDPVFHVYTPENRANPRKYSWDVTASQLKYSTYQPKFKTVFIVHGYQSGYALWMENLKDFIFYISDDKFNVVVVVWENGSKVPIYNLAATNTRVVGACIANFINTICETFNVTNSDFYLIGHSLGAHTIGYAGKRLENPKVARITALDPAGVGFHFTNPRMRLDSSDATIVDVIHTDAALTYTEGFGTADTLGHFDFYPNGGTWQPGCSESDSVRKKIGSIRSGEDITCSHSRACLLLTNLEKPEDECSAIAYQCPSYDMFLEGRCADCREDRCSLMGLNPTFWNKQLVNNKTIGRKYFINTAHKEVFCLQHYQFGLHNTKDSDKTTGYLQFKLKLQMPDNKTKEVEITRMMSLMSPDKIHVFLVNFDFHFSKIYELDLEWKRYNGSDETLSNRGYRLKIPFIEINYMSLRDPKARKKMSSVLCMKDPTTKIIPDKGAYIFKPCKQKLNQTATETDPKDLVPLEAKEHIHSVDYKRMHRVFHKIVGTKIKEKIRKYELVL